MYNLKKLYLILNLLKSKDLDNGDNVATTVSGRDDIKGACHKLEENSTGMEIMEGNLPYWHSIMYVNSASHFSHSIGRRLTKKASFASQTVWKFQMEN